MDNACSLWLPVFPESLRFSSAISVLLAVVFVGICSVMAIYALIEGKTKSPRLLPHLDNKTSFFDLFTAAPVIVTAFTFHFNGENAFWYLNLYSLKTISWHCLLFFLSSSFVECVQFIQ